MKHNFTRHWAQVTHMLLFRPRVFWRYFVLWCMCWLVFFLSTWHNHLGRWNLNWKKCLHRIGFCANLMGIFFFFMNGMGGPAHCGRCHAWAGGSKPCKKANWVNQEEQACKQNFFMASASVPTSRFLPLVPIMESFNNGFWLGCKSQINHFLLNLFFAMVFITAILNKPRQYRMLEHYKGRMTLINWLCSVSALWS